MIASPVDLTYFLEIASTLNISRAAERLGIRQPSLTLSIQRLERDLGTQIFLRSKRGVTLTQAGKDLYSQTKDLLQRWEYLRSQAISSVSTVRGNLTIGCHPSVGLYSLPHFIPRALTQFPELEINLIHDLSRKIAEGVISMAIDLGIVVNAVRHPDLVIHKLCADEVSLWKSKNKIKTADVLICDLELLQTQAVLKKLDKSGLKFKRVLKSGNLEVIRSLTESGAGIGILPGRVAGLGKNLVKVGSSPKFADEISLIYRMEKKDVANITAVGTLIRKYFSNH